MQSSSEINKLKMQSLSEVNQLKNCVSKLKYQKQYLTKVYESFQKLIQTKTSLTFRKIALVVIAANRIKSRK